MGLIILYSSICPSWTDFSPVFEARHLFGELSTVATPTNMASSQIPISYAAAATSALVPAHLPKKFQVNNENGAKVFTSKDKGRYLA